MGKEEDNKALLEYFKKVNFIRPKEHVWVRDGNKGHQHGVKILGEPFLIPTIEMLDDKEEVKVMMNGLKESPNSTVEYDTEEFQNEEETAACVIYIQWLECGRKDVIECCRICAPFFDSGGYKKDRPSRSQRSKRKRNYHDFEEFETSLPVTKKPAKTQKKSNLELQVPAAIPAKKVTTDIKSRSLPNLPVEEPKQVQFSEKKTKGRENAKKNTMKSKDNKESSVINTSTKNNKDTQIMNLPTKSKSENPKHTFLALAPAPAPVKKDEVPTKSTSPVKSKRKLPTRKKNTTVRAHSQSPELKLSLAQAGKLSEDKMEPLIAPHELGYEGNEYHADNKNGTMDLNSFLPLTEFANSANGSINNTINSKINDTINAERETLEKLARDFMNSNSTLSPNLTSLTESAIASHLDTMKYKQDSTPIAPLDDSASLTDNLSIAALARKHKNQANTGPGIGAADLSYFDTIDNTMAHRNNLSAAARMNPMSHELSKEADQRIGENGLPSSLGSLTDPMSMANNLSVASLVNPINYKRGTIDLTTQISLPLSLAGFQSPYAAYPSQAQHQKYSQLYQPQTQQSILQSHRAPSYIYPQHVSQRMYQPLMFQSYSPYSSYHSHLQPAVQPSAYQLQNQISSDMLNQRSSLLSKKNKVPESKQDDNESTPSVLSPYMVDQFADAEKKGR